MSTVDMPPNAHSAGAGKKNKNKKSNSNVSQANRNQLVVQQVQPQPRPETPKEVEEKEVATETTEPLVVEKNTKNKKKNEKTLKTSCDDLVDLNSDNERSSQSSQTQEEEEEEETVAEVKVEQEIEKVEQQEAEKTLVLIETTNNEVTSPPLAPPRKSHQVVKATSPMPSPKVASVPAKEMIPPRSRNSSVSYLKGQIVNQAEPMSPTIVGSVAELVQDVMPKSQSQVSTSLVEKAEWVQMFSVERAGNSKERLDVLLIGLLRGYQIWTLTQNGDCEEVLSIRQGPIRAFQLLPQYQKLDEKIPDALAGQRPLMAIVDATSPMPDRQYCTCQIVSLATGHTIHRLTFDEQIVSLTATEQYLAISLSNRVVVYDTLKFKEIRTVTTLQPAEMSAPAVAMTGQLLAFADRKLNMNLQSGGGLATEVEATSSDNYTDQMMNVMNVFSRTVKSIGESVTASVTGTSTAKLEAAKGVVTVLDLTRSTVEPTYGVMCHWVAHVDGISYITFSPDQRLVVTADSTASVFNVFLLLPHPETPSLASVQHLYKLHRGNTPAKVSSTSFSIDSRWLAIATNHGTCHVFAICPFGGRPTNRTHGDMFVNKESRFHRSAGLTDVADLTASLGPSKQRAMMEANPYTKEHPVAQMNKVLARTNGNSRVGPFPPPLQLYAVKKIRDVNYSTDNITARAQDMTSLSISQTRRLDSCRVSVLFASKSYQPSSATAKTSLLNLLIARADPNAGAVVCEYQLTPRRQEATSQGTKHLEDYPKLNTVQTAVWTLQRSKHNADMHLPMQQGSPLMNMYSRWTKKENQIPGEEKWTPQVEYRTYLPPHRWLWQGPQFQFYSYKEESAVLMSPHDAPPSGSFKTIPVVVGGGSGGSGGADGNYCGSTQIPSDATRIECGSYTSTNGYSMSTASTHDIQMKIADAMRDIPSTSPPPDDEKDRDYCDYEEFYDTHSPTLDRRGSSKSSSTKSKKAPMCAPPPPPPTKPASKRPDDDDDDEDDEDEDDVDDLAFEMEDVDMDGDDDLESY